MPIERYVVGTGLTKRDRRRIKFSKPPTAEERVAAKGAFKNLTFDRAVEEAEAWAIEVLKDAGLRTDGLACVAEMQSKEWYADVIVRRISRNRAAIIRVAAGRGDQADDLARANLNLGYLICEAKLKFEWEDDALRGIRAAAHQKTIGQIAAENRRKRNAFIRALADQHRKEGKRSDSDIARHIKNRAGREISRVDGDNVDPNTAKLWNDISKRAKHTIRGIISKKVE